MDTLWSSWPPNLLYVFLPLAIISKIILKLLAEGVKLILIAPNWPRRPWFADLVALSVVPPWRLPRDPQSLSKGPLLHPDIDWLQLTTWRLSGRS